MIEEKGFRQREQDVGRPGSERDYGSVRKLQNVEYNRDIGEI